MNASNKLKQSADDECAPCGGFAACIGRLLITSTILLAILYASIIAIGRTEGAKQVFLEHLKKITVAESVAIESFKIGYDLDLLLAGVRIADKAGVPGVSLEIENARISCKPRLSYLRPVRCELIEVYGGKIDLIAELDEGSSPFFHSLQQVALAMQRLATEKTSIQKAEKTILDNIDPLFEGEIDCLTENVDINYHAQERRPPFQLHLNRSEIARLIAPSRITLNYFYLKAPPIEIETFSSLTKGT